MRVPFLLYAVLFLLLSGCSPKISTVLTKEYPTLSYTEKVTVLGLEENQPENSEILGEVKVRDTGFSTKCNYEVALDKAKLEARNIGGNAIKITRHKKPDLWSTCHRLDALILRITP